MRKSHLVVILENSDREEWMGKNWVREKKGRNNNFIALKFCTKIKGIIVRDKNKTCTTRDSFYRRIFFSYIFCVTRYLIAASHIIHYLANVACELLNWILFIISLIAISTLLFFTILFFLSVCLQRIRRNTREGREE